MVFGSNGRHRLVALCPNEAHDHGNLTSRWPGKPVDFRPMAIIPTVYRPSYAPVGAGTIRPSHADRVTGHARRQPFQEAVHAAETTSREDASRYPVHEIDPGFSGRAPVRPPAVPAMMCVFCANQALTTDGLQDDPDSADLTPRFHRALRRSGPGR